MESCRSRPKMWLQEESDWRGARSTPTSSVKGAGRRVSDARDVKMRKRKASRRASRERRQAMRLSTKMSRIEAQLRWQTLRGLACVAVRAPVMLFRGLFLGVFGGRAGRADAVEAPAVAPRAHQARGAGSHRLWPPWPAAATPFHIHHHRYSQRYPRCRRLAARASTLSKNSSLPPSLVFCPLSSFAVRYSNTSLLRYCPRRAPSLLLALPYSSPKLCCRPRALA